MTIKCILIFNILLSSLFASSTNLGSDLPLFSIIPFIGILLSIAIIPLISSTFWHHNFGKISAFWSILFIFPFIYNFGVHECIYELSHVILLEYFPFIILLLSLYTISGGIKFNGTILGTPLLNTTLLFIGTILASWMGTTGASMVLIRPLILANNYRKYKVHTIIFFIFLVANVGGSLTPLGDPPLFLGFLSGIDFFWTTKTMFFPMIMTALILLFIYFVLDYYYYRKKEYKIVTRLSNEKKITISGSFNLILIVGVVCSVLISGFWKPNISIPDVLGVHLEFQNITRDIFLLILTYISWAFTPKTIRQDNAFSWFPILEVSKLFACIFITIIPAIAILKAGLQGKLSFLISMLTTSDGSPINSMYFWLTGTLSSFLDNAPTYLVFFNLAGSNAFDISEAEYLMNVIPDTLLAISMGAVFMGAMTYIGNAPNFMVRSIAEESNIKMPSFFGYILWSFTILTPIYFLIGLIFI